MVTLGRRRSRSRGGVLLPRQVGALVAVGAIERGDPIPPGVYWIDSIDADAFDDAETVVALRAVYLEQLAIAHPGAYRVVRTVRHDDIGQPGRDWILFEVLTPVPRWPVGTRWGLPTIAPRGVDTQEGDTVQKPPPEKGPLDSLINEPIPTWVWVVGGGLAVGGLLYAIAK